MALAGELYAIGVRFIMTGQFGAFNKKIKDPRFTQVLDFNLRPAGIEPATDGLEIRSSIQLSYGRKNS